MVSIFQSTLWQPSWCNCNGLYLCSTKTREGLGNPSPTPKRFPETREKGLREIWRAEGRDYPIPSKFWWSTDNLSASIFLQGVDQKILPSGQGKIDSVTISPSQLLMRECAEIKKRGSRIRASSHYVSQIYFFRPPSPLVINRQHLPDHQILKIGQSSEIWSKL